MFSNFLDLSHYGVKHDLVFNTNREVNRYKYRIDFVETSGWFPTLKRFERLTCSFQITDILGFPLFE